MLGSLEALTGTDRSGGLRSAGYRDRSCDDGADVRTTHALAASVLSLRFG
jgi:hypothetical protein